MRSFYRFFLGLHRWLLVNLAVLAAFFLLRGQRAIANLLCFRAAMPFERAVGSLCARLPFSVGELLYAAAGVAAVLFILLSIRAVWRAEYRREVLYRRFMILLNTALSVYAAFCLLWGVNYYADGFCDRAGLRRDAVSVEELTRVTAYFAQQLTDSAWDVPRDADDAFAAARDEILAYAPSLYDETMYEEFPFLRLSPDPVPKKMLFSRLMSEMNFTGFYCPFTGECNVNTDFPADQLAATAAHELAHRRGIASEQECNFIAVLAASRSENPLYRYSGWMMGYIHLSNALYSVDADAWRAIRAALPDPVLADLYRSNQYWSRFEGLTAEVSTHAYDAMLRSNGQSLGMRSYGAVVDLLVSYYGERI